MITKHTNLSFQGKHQKPILYDVFYRESIEKKPIVIFCHGYKGFKDWGAWDVVAEAFARAGFFFLKFNFSHNGTTQENPKEFKDLEAFGHNNYVKELDDLEQVIDELTASSYQFQSQLSSDQITLIGHSRGGGIVLLKAAEDTRISRVITWAGVSDYGRRFVTGEALDEWKENGVIYVENSRTNQKMPHYYQFFENYLNNKDRLNIRKATRTLEVPILIIHGTTDKSVDVEEAKTLHDENEESELYLIPAADHVFGAKHPWILNYLPGHLQDVVQKSIEFAIF